MFLFYYIVYNSYGGNFVKKIILLFSLLVLILLVSCASRPNFKKIYKEYGEPYWADVAGDNSYLRIDTNPYDIEDELDFDAYYAILSINEEFGCPESLNSKMGETTALDGRQTEEYKNVIVSWKYHPDSGLEVMYESAH